VQHQAWHRIEELFAAALELPADARDAFCLQASGHDCVLRDELLSLLRAHAAAANPLDASPIAALIAPAAQQALNAAGQRIGVWHVNDLIRRGGAGEVYQAHRADGAFNQVVALKLLYRDAAADVDRFHAERQILAGLDHPGIARLLDGGVTPDGRLFAVVEYVQGQSLVEYCSVRQSNRAERLALFLQVCEAVAYAHRNLIVHRDLKPGNILVNAQGQVKLLDFGVAKRLDPASAAAANETRAPYTPDYAAPEQLTGQAITTATDVFALGVVLFELLSGERPWRSDGLPLARLVQLITHDEAPSPSAVARRRGSAAPVPARQLEGDLDAIVATCLRKPAADRYPTVQALAHDIGRHLRNEPVAARGRSRAYLLGRVLRRYRWSAAAAALVFLSLAAGLTATAWQARRAEAERDAARRAATREEAIRFHLTNLFRNAIAQKDGSPITAKTMLDRSTQRLLKEYRDDPQLTGRVVVTLADLYGALGDVEGQVPLLEGFLAAAGPQSDRESVALARQKLASVQLLRGHTAPAAVLLDQAEAQWAAAPERYREQRLEGQLVRGLLQRAQGDLDASTRTLRSAIEERSAYSGAVHRETAILYNSLAITLTSAGRMDEALAAYRTTLDIYDKLGQSEEPDALVILANAGTLAFRLGRLREGEQTLKAAYERQRARAGDSAAVAAAMGQYGTVASILGRHEEALDVLRTATDMATSFAGAASPLAIQDRLFLSEAWVRAGDLARGRTVAAQNLALARERLGNAAALTLRVQLGQARIALESGQAAQAHAEFSALVEPLRRTGKASELLVAQALVGSGEALLAMGRPAEAIEPLKAAVALREQLLWAQSWELAWARGLLGAALQRAKEAGGAELVKQAEATLIEQLGAAHPQVLRLRQALGGGAG
jgi:eukaryotic-like serine/threonine-protein kinase